MLLEISIVIVLTLLNGVLAMSELAIVSSRPARLKVLSDQGSRGATMAIRLAEEPGRFLSTVQIGITLVGVLSGAFSGATLGARLSGWLAAQGLSVAAADAIGVGSVVMAITYLSLIIGELVPKQVALRAPELVASKVAPAMVFLSRAAAPLVWLLDLSGRLVLRALGQSGKVADGVSDEEIKTVLAEAQSAGVIATEEQAMISGVMRLADRTARALMTPRRDVEVIDIEDSFGEVREQIRRTEKARLPLRKDSSDEIVGVLTTRDFFDALASGGQPDILKLGKQVPIVSDLSSALDVVKALRRSSSHMVLVYDEYGHFEGVITSGDILEAILGAVQGRRRRRRRTGNRPSPRRQLSRVRLDAHRRVRRFHEPPDRRRSRLPDSCRLRAAGAAPSSGCGRKLHEKRLALRGRGSRRPPDRQVAGELGKRRQR